MIKILAIAILLSVNSPLLASQGITPVWWLPYPVYTNPDESICREVWRREHSMCNGNAVVEVANQDWKEIDLAIQAIKVEMDSLAKKLENPDSRVSKSSYEGLAFYKQFRDQGIRDKVVESAKRCAVHLKSVRARALCFICSGEQQNYFFRSKAIITESTCSAMVAECLDFFHYSVGLVQGMADLGFTLNQATSNWDSDSKKILRNFNERYQILLQKLRNAKLVEIMAQYKPSASASSLVCARLFRLRKTAFVASMATFMRFVNANIGDFVKVANNYSRRLLESSSTDFGFDPFEGDVAILTPQDNMFTSFDGTQGSSLANDNSYAKAMNLTTCFP